MSRTVLVVDDSMLIRHTVCRFLEERGFTVESAINGKEALKVLARILPDLIVTDLQMPQMTGPELICELKKNPRTAAIPIIVLAAKRTATDPTMETPAEVVIYKDIDIEQQLENAIATIGELQAFRG